MRSDARIFEGEGPAASPGALRPVVAASAWLRLRGLLARPRSWLAPDEALVLVPCASIHTFGMRWPVDAAFADARGVVLASFHALEPGSLASCPGAVVALERVSEEGDGAGGRPRWPREGEQLALSPAVPRLGAGVPAVCPRTRPPTGGGASFEGRSRR